MRLLLLTPGTGHFYCGSCLRDHSLARALIALDQEDRAVDLLNEALAQSDDDPEAKELLASLSRETEVQS